MALCALARTFISTQAQMDSDAPASTLPVIPRPLGEHFQVHVHLDLRQLRPEVASPLPAHAAHAYDCRFPGCSEHRHVEAHHVEHWAEGGDTALSNLVELCHHHHRLVHEGGFSIRAKANDKPAFIDPKGCEIANPWPQPSLPDDPVKRLRHRQRHLNIDWRSSRSGWTGEALNINDAIQALESRGWLGAAADAPSPDR